jgi:hypothetical protein
VCQCVCARVRGRVQARERVCMYTRVRARVRDVRRCSSPADGGGNAESISHGPGVTGRESVSQSVNQSRAGRHGPGDSRRCSSPARRRPSPPTRRRVPTRAPTHTPPPRPHPPRRHPCARRQAPPPPRPPHAKCAKAAEAGYMAGGRGATPCSLQGGDPASSIAGCRRGRRCGGEASVVGAIPATPAICARRCAVYRSVYRAV